MIKTTTAQAMHAALELASLERLAVERGVSTKLARRCVDRLTTTTGYTTTQAVTAVRRWVVAGDDLQELLDEL